MKAIVQFATATRSVVAGFAFLSVGNGRATICRSLQVQIGNNMCATAGTPKVCSGVVCTDLRQPHFKCKFIRCFGAFGATLPSGPSLIAGDHLVADPPAWLIVRDAGDG